jgi:aldehyde dehydrogenase (NAD+)
MNTFSVNKFQQMRQYFLSGETKDYLFRKKQLRVLKHAVKKYETALIEALFKDLHKSPEEAFATEIGFIYSEISHTLSNLKSWMEPQRVSSPIVLFPSSSKIIREPLGVCLIIAPWNYPFQLLVAPLIGAIAGGNCAVLNPLSLPHLPLLLL